VENLFSNTYFPSWKTLTFASKVFQPFVKSIPPVTANNFLRKGLREKFLIMYSYRLEKKEQIKSRKNK